MHKGFWSKQIIFTATLCALCLFSSRHAAAQAQNQAVGLIRDAMTAYGNLDLDMAKARLDQALAMSPQLTAGTVARIYMGYGLIFVGGNGDNARGQESFTIARCLDPTVQIDPLYSTPEVDMIYRMAQARATAQTCPSLIANIRYSATPSVQPVPVQPMPVQPMPVQPMPVQPMMTPGMLPACGQHTPPAQQRQSHELPLAVHLDPNAEPHIDRMVVKFSFDGSPQFTEAPMQKAGNGWATGMITCVEGQITAFNPATIAYFIEGYNQAGTLICGHGNAAQAYQVSMNPAAPVVTGMPGMPTPQMCQECPPWDQACQARSGQPIPCFSAEDCLAGQTCSDSGFCEGGDYGPDSGWGEEGGGEDNSGQVPRVFYINISAGTGGGFVKNSDIYLETTTSTGGTDGLASYLSQGLNGGGWGGLPLRAALGFNIKPVFALEATFRMDLSAAWRSQRSAAPCTDPDGTTDSAGYICYSPHLDTDGFYGVWGWEDSSGVHIYTTETKQIAKSWLINLRARYRFVNDGKLQVSFFGGVGYGHLFFAPKAKDVDFDGVVDRKIATPGMVNLELGPGLAFYFTKNVGFILEAPIDLVFGEAGSFGLNGELMIGLSFGG